MGPLEARVAQILYEHFVNTDIGPRFGPGRFTIRCPKCGIVAASDYPISPLRVGAAHQARLVLKAIAGAS